MINSINFKESGRHALRMLTTMLAAYPFFKEHKLWKGFTQHKWIAMAAVLISILYSYSFLANLTDFLYQEVSVPIDSSGVVDGEALETGKKTAFHGGSKYLLMILLEIVIFHFSIRTIEIKTKTKSDATFQSFWEAEWRMVHVMIRNFVYAILMQVGVWVVFGILGWSALKPVAMFFVYAFFMGFAFLDNYNELYKIDIKKSDLIARHHFGGALALGCVISVMLHIPVLGPFVAPIFGAISANLYGHEYKIHETEIVAEDITATSA